MIDTVSGVPGSLRLSVLAWCVASVVIAIIVLKGISYYFKPRFMEIAMRQYKDFAFRKLTKKSISTFNVENTANYQEAVIAVLDKIDPSRFKSGTLTITEDVDKELEEKFNESGQSPILPGECETE